jgi:hypothetical protein
MTSEQLITEGRKIQRPCVFLRPEGTGPVAAVWHERDEDEIESTGHHCWLTVDSRQIPSLPESVTGYISILSNEEDCEGGRVEISPSWPKRAGTKLYAHAVSVLPPIDAVFARGSDVVEAWIRACGWERSERYNNNFKDKAVVDAYDDIHRQEYPLYFDSDIYAMLGGWHWPGQDDDWHDLIDEQLMALTFRDSEPWVEAWRTRTGKFKVIQRIT